MVNCQERPMLVDCWRKMPEVLNDVIEEGEGLSEDVNDALVVVETLSGLVMMMMIW